MPRWFEVASHVFVWVLSIGLTLMPVIKQDFGIIGINTYCWLLTDEAPDIVVAFIVPTFLNWFVCVVAIGLSAVTLNKAKMVRPPSRLSSRAHIPM